MDGSINHIAVAPVDESLHPIGIGDVGESARGIFHIAIVLGAGDHDVRIGPADADPVELGNQYIVAVITGAEKEGSASAKAARPLVENLVRNEKKAQMIISTKFKGGNTIEAVAQGAGQQVQRADSVSFAQPFISNVGNEPKITGAAFNKSQQGKITEPIAGNTGVFVVKGENISAISGGVANAEELRKQMVMQQKQMGGFRSLDALKKAATIKDNRSEFY